SRVMLRGDVPSPANPPSGCVFHPRCQHPAKDAACATLVPPLEEKAPGHWVACIKQPPTGVDWSIQKAAGGTNPPARYLPVIAAQTCPPTESSWQRRQDPYSTSPTPPPSPPTSRRKSSR